jgi:type III secretion protein R
MDPYGLIGLMAVLSLAAVLVVAATSFAKIAIVLVVIRNAIGIQQVPPNVVLFVIALAWTGYVMAPVMGDMRALLQKQESLGTAALLDKAGELVEPLRLFLSRNSQKRYVTMLLDSHRNAMARAQRAPSLDEESLLVVLPAFLMSEVTLAFSIGFLLYIPFIVVDLILAILLQSLSITMLSPTVLSTPIKLLLFVAVDGWDRLFDLLSNAYRY